MQHFSEIPNYPAPIPPLSDLSRMENMSQFANLQKGFLNV